MDLHDEGERVDELLDLRGDVPLFDDPTVSSDDLLPPEPPVPERRPFGGGPGARRIVRFAPWFFAIAALVGIERVSMILVVSESVSMSTRAIAFAVFVGVVLLVMVVGGWLFARNFGK